MAKVRGAFRLAAVDLRAARIGLKPGMPLADARAMVPHLAIHDADSLAEADALLALVDWCRLFTPLAALDAPDGAMLDVTGVAHLFGGEAALLDRIVDRLAAQGFAARAAIAGTPGAAWALARYGGTRRLIPADAQDEHCAKVFAAMPLAALRLEADALARFAQAGLRQVGDLLLRPRAPVAARFGSAIHARLDELFGRARPISPHFEAPAFVAERRFAEGITEVAAIESTILALAYDVCGLLARHGEGARRLDVSLFRVDGAVRHIDAGTSRPLRDPLAMARLFRERIAAAGEDGLDTGYGFDVVRLAVLAAERLDPHQPSWDEAGGEAADLDDLIDRLGARFGLARVVRLILQDTHLPERAAVAVAAGQPHAAGGARQGLGGTSVQATLFRPDDHASSGRKPSRRGQALSIQASLVPTLPTSTLPAPTLPVQILSSTPAEPPMLPSPTLPERPIRLLQRPEPVETIAGVPDGPPVRFSWRRVEHHVAAIEGPERIGAEWWKGGAPTRDYFRAEDTAGQRFWLYREGLYGEVQAPRWFMHGLFA